MTSYRYHSGYLADDEAGHSTYAARPPKKPLLPEMGKASKLGPMPQPPSMHSLWGSSGLHSHRQNLRGPRPFRSFLDFLVEGQVLDSLQTVVEKATELMATMKTEAGVPLVEVQDPVEVPRGGQRAHARPSLSTVHRHRTRPSLCMGSPNNYPSCSSSTSNSHSSFTIGWPGSYRRNSDMGPRGWGPLPPMKDQLLLEKNLRRLMQLENQGKGLGQPCSHRDSLLWNSLGSQASSQWTPEQPLSWVSGLLGSSSDTPKASELGPGERELLFLKRELHKEIKSLLSQPASFNLPGYHVGREPHRTLDFLAKHHLFPALQNVVKQAVDKLSSACLRDGYPLFPSEWEPATESTSKVATPTNREEPYDSLTTTASSPKISHRKSFKCKSHSGKPKEVGSLVSSTQMATRFRLKSPSYKLTEKKLLPSILSESSGSHLSNPWQEELVSYLRDQAVSLLIYKYKFEKNLTRQLGFISFPVTEALMDLFLGFKKVKGSRIHLSSKVDWSCLLRRLEEAECSQQASRQVSRHTSPQHSTHWHRARTPSTLPKPATKTTRIPEKAREPHPDRQSPSPRLLTPQESMAAGKKEPARPPEPKLSTFSNTSVASSQSWQTVDVGDNQSLEEEEDEYKVEDEEEDEKRDEEEDYFFGGEGEPHSSPEPQVEVKVRPWADADVGHGDPP
ncbi:coiled-coil domain-containing protein 116 [Vicugna pacos]|uniref:Coiled-coil domain-containing protein 116 n=1 Tax=Vicugna pacos TaxID=30538 RepID=A0ABM5CKT3_VICPA|nr:coiled-coil domain-containing protein 116 [Vicugna pacos]